MTSSADLLSAVSSAENGRRFAQTIRIFCCIPGSIALGLVSQNKALGLFSLSASFLLVSTTGTVI